jgi:hypothetical protein
VEFLSGWKLWCKRTGALAKLGNLLGILVNFWKVKCGLGPNRQYFLEIEGHAVNPPNIQGPCHNLQQPQGIPCKNYELFPKGKTHGPVVLLGPWWTERQHGHQARRRIAGMWHARHYRAGDEEGDKAEPARGSLKLKR